MTAIVLPQPADSHSSGRKGVQLAVAVTLAAWFLLVVSLGLAGAFVGLPGQPPLSMALAVAVPLLLFFGWLRASPAFRDFVLSIDIRLNVAIQAWRWAGMGFLDLYAHRVLPGFFALPAGLGDLAVGVTAPWVILALLRRADFAASRAFIRWNLFGILDLVVAISLGTLGSILATGTPGEISTTPMATVPLLLIPGYFVPLFLMLHVAALLQSRQLMRNRPSVPG